MQSLPRDESLRFLGDAIKLGREHIELQLMIISAITLNTQSAEEIGEQVISFLPYLRSPSPRTPLVYTSMPMQQRIRLK